MVFWKVNHPSPAFMILICDDHPLSVENSVRNDAHRTDTIRKRNNKQTPVSFTCLTVANLPESIFIND